MGLKELFRLPSALRPSISQSQVTIWLLRISVTTFQAIGSFPYTWSGPPRRPQLSVALCVWSVVIKILQIYGAITIILSYYIPTDDSDGIQIGDVIANIYMIFCYVSLNLAHLAVLFRSPVLATCLDLIVNDPQIMSTESLSCTGLLVTFLVHVGISIAWGIGYCVYTFSIFSAFSAAAMFASALVEAVGLLSCCLLFKGLFLILSTRLVDVAREGLASQSLQGPGLVFGPGFQKGPPLVSLERGIRQVMHLYPYLYC